MNRNAEELCFLVPGALPPGLHEGRTEGDVRDAGPRLMNGFRMAMRREEAVTRAVAVGLFWHAGFAPQKRHIFEIDCKRKEDSGWITLLYQ